MSIELAQKVLNHLQKTNQGFCFVNGTLISVEDCLAIINK